MPFQCIINTNTTQGDRGITTVSFAEGHEKQKHTGMDTTVPHKLLISSSFIDKLG